MPRSQNKASKRPLRANPAPLGLMGFGMTTVLLNMVNVGLLSISGSPSGMGMILAMGIFYGGLAQILAGILEFKNGNTFGTVAFCSYGFFWMSWAALKIFPALGLAGAVDARSMAAYLIMWGVFTTYMFVGTLKRAKALRIVFLSLAVLFFLLAVADLTGIGAITLVAGTEGIFCGLSAIYLACAEVLNEVYGKTVLPVN